MHHLDGSCVCVGIFLKLLLPQQLHLVVDYYKVYLVGDYMFRSIMLLNTPLILNMNMILSSYFCLEDIGEVLA